MLGAPSPPSAAAPSPPPLINSDYFDRPENPTILGNCTFLLCRLHTSPPLPLLYFPRRAARTAKLATKFCYDVIDSTRCTACNDTVN